MMVNLNQTKLMNEENWVEIETMEMRKNVKKKNRRRKLKNRKRDCWIGNGKKKEKRNEKQQQEKRREMSRNIEEIITMVQLGYEEEESEEKGKNEKGGKTERKR